MHRDDVLRKLQQMCTFIADLESIEPVNATADLTKTLLDQGHLAPFSPLIKPTLWNYDHALRLYPPPNTLCLSDDTAPQFDTVYAKIKVFNPGNFAREGAFSLFRPGTEELEASIL